MNAREFQDALADLFEQLLAAREDHDDPLADLADELSAEIVDVRTYREAGVLTTDRGLVIECADGAELQITIVHSRDGGEDD